jgi:hypothetical protein
MVKNTISWRKVLRGVSAKSPDKQLHTPGRSSDTRKRDVALPSSKEVPICEVCDFRGDSTGLWRRPLSPTAIESFMRV